MKNLFFILILFFSFSCKKEEASATNAMSASSASRSAQDDFSDFKKKDEDESCDTEEDIEKELIKKQKAKDFKLGGSTDCTIQ